MYKDVPLPDDFDLQAALRKAMVVGPSIHGIVLRGKGHCLRTKVRRRKPRGSSEKDGMLSICLSLGAKGGAGFLGWLVLHGRSIFPSREDLERHCPVSGVASPSQVAAWLWARGATQASTSEGLGVVEAWENHGREPESCKILGRRSPVRPQESCCRPCFRQESKGKWRVEGHDRFRRHLSSLDAGLQPVLYTGFALSTLATVRCPAASAFPSPDCWTAREQAACSPSM